MRRDEFQEESLHQDQFSLESKSDKSNLENVFELKPEVEALGLVTSLNERVVDLINQIMLCRLKIVEELVKIKIVDRINESNPEGNEELKKRFNKIEDIKERKLIDLMQVLYKKSKNGNLLGCYNLVDSLQGFVIGRFFLSCGSRLINKLINFLIEW